MNGLWVRLVKDYSYVSLVIASQTIEPIESSLSKPRFNINFEPIMMARAQLSFDRVEPDSNFTRAKPELLVKPNSLRYFKNFIQTENKDIRLSTTYSIFLL